MQGYSATAAGAAGVPAILLLFSLSRWSGGLVARYGARVPLVAGPLIVAAGFALFTIPSLGGTYWRTFFVPYVVLGFGMAVSIAPLTTVVMNAIPSGHAGVASGVNNAVSRIAGLLAIAVLGILMLHAFQSALDADPALTEVSPSVRAQIHAHAIDLAAIKIPAAADPGKVPELQRAVRSSFVRAFRVIMWICAGLAVLSSAVAARWIESRPTPESLPKLGRDASR